MFYHSAIYNEYSKFFLQMEIIEYSIHIQITNWWSPVKHCAAQLQAHQYAFHFSMQQKDVPHQNVNGGNTPTIVMLKMRKWPTKKVNEWAVRICFSATVMRWLPPSMFVARWRVVAATKVAAIIYGNCKIKHMAAAVKAMPKIYMCKIQ